MCLVCSWTEVLKAKELQATSLVETINTNVKTQQQKATAAAAAAKNLSGTTSRQSSIDLRDGKGEAILKKIGRGPHRGFIKVYQEAKGSVCHVEVFFVSP